MRDPASGLSFDDVRRIALSLPEVLERTAYGRPAFYLGKKMLACLGRQDDHLVVRMEVDERDMLIQTDPQTYFLTDHYRGWSYVLVRFPKMDEQALAALLERTWRSVAPRRRAQTRAA